MTAFADAVSEFQLLQEQYAFPYGASDTEPDRVFQVVVYNALHGTEYWYSGSQPPKSVFPTTYTDWELFGDEGVNVVADKMTRAARACRRRPA